MKLAAIYNVWDSEELLQGSINQIIDHVDHVIIVWQRISNFGEFNPDVEKVINSLQGSKIQLIGYEPNPKQGGTRNETNKRNIGLARARELGCSHFIFMDCDEYYDTQQFKAGKDFVINNNLHTSACKLYTYYKEPIYRLTPLEGYYVPFICSTDCLDAGSGFSVAVDPTRGVGRKGNYKLIPDNICMMHHYSYVRKNIERKFKNSSASVNWKHEIPIMVTDFNNWQPGKLMRRFERHNVETVENKFNIVI